jgi:hypothetical protein
MGKAHPTREETKERDMSKDIESKKKLKSRIQPKAISDHLTDSFRNSLKHISLATKHQHLIENIIFEIEKIKSKLLVDSEIGFFFDINSHNSYFVSSEDGKYKISILEDTSIGVYLENSSKSIKITQTEFDVIKNHMKRISAVLSEKHMKDIEITVDSGFPLGSLDNKTETTITSPQKPASIFTIRLSQSPDVNVHSTNWRIKSKRK